MKLINRIIILLLFLSTPKAQYDTISFGLQSLEQNVLQSVTFYRGNLFSGFDLARMGASASNSINYDCDDPYSSGSDYCDDYTNSSSEGSSSINLFMPRVGYRIPFKDNGRLRSYNQIESYLLLPIITSTGDAEISEDYKETLEDALSLLGFKVSHSVQYNFNERLALLADFGFNMILWNMDEGDSEEINSYIIRNTRDEVSLNLGYTYSKISLLFSF